jgi:biotin/methionine sulfoxide reductase
MINAFRADPDAAPLPTPGGKIEIFSATIASFGYENCPGHPVWREPQQKPSADYPFWLIANQPATRLHSQLDFGDYSQRSKRGGREVCSLNRDDAAAQAIADGDIIELFNARGHVIASARLTDTIMPGVVQLPTGAWYDPVEPTAARPLCRHGNPNVLTMDIGTSSLTQGCSGQITVVQVRKFAGDVTPVQAFFPPR